MFFRSKPIILLSLITFASIVVPTLSLRGAPPKAGGGTTPSVKYSFLLLGTLDAPRSRAVGINNRGDVVGFTFDDPDVPLGGFLWTAATGIVDLEDLLPPEAVGVQIISAQDINDARQVVGAMLLPTGETRAYRLTLARSEAPAVLEDLNGSSPLQCDSGQSINDWGDVVGVSGGNGTFIYTEATGPIEIPGDFLFYRRRSINNRGQLAATVVFPLPPPSTSSDVRAGRYNAGTGWQKLGFLKAWGNYDDSFAYDMNATGQIVGMSTAGSAGKTVAYHAFRTNDGVGMTDLGTLGGTNSFAFGVNDSGHVVGRADTRTGSRPFLYTDAVKLKDLTTMVVNVSPSVSASFTPHRINNNGMICGSSVVDPEQAAVLISVSN